MSDCEDYSAMSSETENGEGYELYIPGSKVRAAGEWNPDRSEVPIQINQVFQISNKWAKSNLSKFDSIKIETITLSKYGCPIGGNYWFYIVDYSPIINGQKLWGDGNWFAVLMSKEVIKPIRK